MKLHWIVLGWLMWTAQLPAPRIPAFTFYKADGSAFTTAMIPKGKCSLFLFVDPTCDHCQQAIGGVNKSSNAFTQVNIFIVSLSDHKSIVSFLSTYAPALSAKKNLLTLQDKQNSFIILFGPRRYPGMFLYNRRQQLLDYEDNPLTVYRFVNELKKENNSNHH